MNIEHQFEAIADEYIQVENDPDMSKYELEVNWPSLLKSFPNPPASVLDYGAAGGVYSRIIQDLGYEVLAVDNSPAMVRRITGVPAKQWTYQDGSLDMHFDVVICKLVVQFVAELPEFALAMSQTVADQGRMVISVPNPEKTRNLGDSNGLYATRIGQSDIVVEMIHRELSDYEAAFNPYFWLESVDLPFESGAPGEMSKRLNMIFRKRLSL